MLFLDSKDFLEHAPRRRILVAEVIDDFAIIVDGDAIGMGLLFGRMFREFRRHAVGIDAVRHEVMALVAQNADDLRGKRFVADLDYGFAIGW